MEGDRGGDSRQEASRVVEPPGIGVMDSMSVEWTNEKHRLYLNSMEASFVNQLYKSECQPKDFQRWLSRAKKQSITPETHANNLIPDQFKLLRSGSWEELNFYRTRNQCQAVNESVDLHSNSWIQHFRSSRAPHFITQNPSDQNNLCNQSSALKLEGEVKHPNRYPCPYRDSAESSTEMSDQNFVDIEFKGVAKAGRSCHRKRARTTALPGLVKSFDQVVPQEKLRRAPAQVDVECSGKRNIPFERTQTEEIEHGLCNER